MVKPTNYIETRFEKIDGFCHLQPVEYCNGVSYNDSPQHIKDKWGTYYWDCYKYNSVLNLMKFDDECWNNMETKEKVFDTVLSYLLKDKTMRSVTPLFGFEVYLLNEGFTLVDFGKLHAHEPKGRTFEKGNENIQTSFGYNGVKFYFSKAFEYSEYYRIPFKRDEYIKARNFDESLMII